MGSSDPQCVRPEILTRRTAATYFSLAGKFRFRRVPVVLADVPSDLYEFFRGLVEQGFEHLVHLGEAIDELLFQ